MRAVKTAIITMVAGIIGFFVLPPAVAGADTLVCEGAIVDTTSAQVLDRAKVQSAIDLFKYSHPGADVYVRAFQNTPGGSADDFVKRGLQQCSNWSGIGHNSNDFKSNMILVMFGMDHTSAVDAGDNYPAVKPHIDAIRDNDLGDHLRSGKYNMDEFTLGVTSALNSLDAAASGHLASPSSGPSGDTVFTVFMWILGIIASIAIAYGIYRYLRHRSYLRKQEDARLVAQASARQARIDATNRVTNARTDEELHREFLMATGNMPQSMIDKHQKTFDSIDTSCDEQINLCTQLGELPATDVEAKQTEGVYRDLERQYNSIAATLKAADESYTKLFADIREDVIALTSVARRARWDKINGFESDLEQELSVCQQVFDVAPTRAKLTKLQQQVQEAQADLDSVEKAVASYEQLGILEQSVAKLTQEVNGLTSDRTKIVGARALIGGQITARRRMLQSLQHVNADEPVKALVQLESAADRFVGTNVTSGRSRTDQLKSIDEYIEEIEQTGGGEVDTNEAIEAKIRHDQEEKRKAEEAERRRLQAIRDEEIRQERARQDAANAAAAAAAAASTSYYSSSDGGGSSISTGTW